MQITATEYVEHLWSNWVCVSLEEPRDPKDGYRICHVNTIKNQLRSGETMFSCKESFCPYTDHMERITAKDLAESLSS